jgi:WD40 repeat protein
MKEIICPAAEISSMYFHPKGNAILGAFKDGSINLYSAKTGNELGQFFGHTSEVYGAYFTPDSKYIISIGGDKTLRKWDPKQNKEIGRLGIIFPQKQN